VWYNGTRSITLATESLAVPLMILALFALARARDGRHVVGWALGGGLLLGACALARGNLVLLAPLGAAWLAVATPRGTWAGSGRAALVLLGAAAALVPWMWRNHERLGMFTLASQREPLFLGNNAWARGSYDGEFISDPRGRQFEWLNARHPGFAGRSEIEKSRIYAQEAVAFMREHPRREAWLVARRGLLFFSPLRETDDGDLALDWTFGAVVLLCAPAIGWIVAARDRGALLLVVPVLAVLATCLAVLFLPRYRYPAEPMMVALACQGAQVASRRLGVAAMVATVGLVLAINLVAALFLM
jgi:4-amino-4-deoxy-L-arabinose transferase-like glycosyltransferase